MSDIQQRVAEKGIAPTPGSSPKKPGFRHPTPSGWINAPNTIRPFRTSTTHPTKTTTHALNTKTNTTTLTRISTTQPKREREPSSYSSPYARTQNPLLDNANRARVIEAFEKPSLPIDMDEFRREVADQGLKTLKDSRWAK